MPRKRKDSMTTNQLADVVSASIKNFSSEEKTAARAALRKQANLSSLAGRARYLHGLAEAAILIKSEEACFQEVWDFFENLKTENVKYKM